MRCTRVDGRWIFSRYDGIALLTGESDQSNVIWQRMKRDHPDVDSTTPEGSTISTPFRVFQFDGAGENETPVTDIEGLVQMFLLVPGRRAAVFRRQVSELFVRFAGGDLSLIDDLERAALVQKRLREEQPNHPATAFGEAAGAACDQEELIAKRRRLQLELAVHEELLAKAKAETEAAKRVAAETVQAASEQRRMANARTWLEASAAHPLLALSEADRVAAKVSTASASDASASASDSRLRRRPLLRRLARGRHQAGEEPRTHLQVDAR
jgi:hypothetical protein